MLNLAPKVARQATPDSAPDGPTGGSAADLGVRPTERHEFAQFLCQSPQPGLRPNNETPTCDMLIPSSHAKRSTGCPKTD